MKNLLVLYDQSWIKNELPTPRSLKYAKLTFRQVSFKDAPMQETKEGTKIADTWIMPQVNTQMFDGVVLAMNGDKLNGRNGVHIKKIGARGRFSILQVEAKRGVYRSWKQNKDGTWFLESSRKGSYKQLEYTFDHELGHCIKYQRFEPDDLHTHVSRKEYEEWWSKQVVKKW